MTRLLSHCLLSNNSPSMHLKINFLHKDNKILCAFIGKRGSCQTKAPTYDYPDNFLDRTPKDNDIKLTECPAYEKPKKVVDIELKECPAYGQLHAIQST